MLIIVRCSLAVALVCGAALAQDPAEKPTPGREESDRLPLQDQVKWQRGPVTGKLKGDAEIQVPADFIFTEADGAKKLMTASGNPLSHKEAGLIAPADFDWFIIFEYDDCGYVKDEDRNLDADAILEALRAGNDAANEERKKSGFSPLEITGWETRPRYNPQTHNLEWATRAESEGQPVINHNTRLLGRRGVMEVTLVCDPSQLSGALPDAATLLAGYSFTAGNRYAEWKSGDKIAEYGLAALITGGAAAVALKTGLFQKLWKVGVVALIAIAAFFRKIFSAIFGRRSEAR